MRLVRDTILCMGTPSTPCSVTWCLVGACGSQHRVQVSRATATACAVTGQSAAGGADDNAGGWSVLPAGCLARPRVCLCNSAVTAAVSVRHPDQHTSLRAMW